MGVPPVLIHFRSGCSTTSLLKQLPLQVARVVCVEEGEPPGWVLRGTADPLGRCKMCGTGNANEGMESQQSNSKLSPSLPFLWVVV